MSFESRILQSINSLADKKRFQISLLQGERRTNMRTIKRTVTDHDNYFWAQFSYSSSSYCILKWLLFYYFRYLDKNELKEISSDAFDGLKNLESL